MLALKRRNFLWNGLIIIISSTVFFINIKTTHDWGDDFAQYIHQAKNIAKGIPQSETGYIYNPQYAMLGPPSYPVGFPLLLAPVFALFGNNMIAFNYFVSFFLFLFCISCFYFFKKQFSNLSALLLALVMVLNPFLLQFKTEINSDIPFSFFLVLLFLLYEKKETSLLRLILLTLLAGFLVSIRTIGTAFLIAVFLEQCFFYFKHKNKFDVKSMWIIPIGGFVFYLLLNYVVFNLPVDFLTQPSSHFSVSEMYKTVLSNFAHYALMDQQFFYTSDANMFVGFALVLMSSLLCLSLLGFVTKLITGISLTEIFVLLYLLVLLVYPYQHAGLRFLIPIIPFLLFYAASTLQLFIEKWKVTKAWKISIPIVTIVLLVYMYDLRIIYGSQAHVINGPLDQQSKRTFNFIKNNLPDDERILFMKPRALALYSEKKSCATGINATMTQIDNAIASHNLDYILINEEISGDSIKKFAGSDTTWHPVFKNDLYRLYKIKSSGFILSLPKE